jgi:hypothetical protein
MKPQKRKKLYALIEQQTRCEIVARFAPIGWQEYGDYGLLAIEKIDEIRKLLFGTSNLLELGQRWGILQEIKNEKEHKSKQELRKTNNSGTKNKSSRKSHLRRSLRHNRRC